MKFILGPFYIVMIGVFLLTMFTNISFGEPFGSRQKAIRDNFETRALDNLAKSGNDQDIFHLQNSKRSIHMAKKKKPVSKQDMPFCCYQTRFEIDEKIDELKKSIKTLRSCKGKKRIKTCGSWKRCSHRTGKVLGSDKNTNEKATDVDTSTNFKPTADNANKVNKKDETGTGAVSLGSKDTKSELKNKKKASLLLSDECLTAIDHYLHFYRSGEGEIYEYLGKRNLNRLRKITKLENVSSDETSRLYISEIVLKLIECQHNAFARENINNFLKLNEILHVIKYQYYNQEDFAELYDKFYGDK